MSNPTTFNIAVETDGTATLIYDDAHADFLAQGTAVVTRASNVEPAPQGAGWVADMSPVGGPTLGPYALRSQALAAEVAYLERLLF
jgi:hypothetical protein